MTNIVRASLAFHHANPNPGILNLNLVDAIGVL